MRGYPMTQFNENSVALISTLGDMKEIYVVEINDLEEKRQRCLEQLQATITQKAQLEHGIILLQGEITNARKMLRRLVGEETG
jgi:hypothetical protein